MLPLTQNPIWLELQAHYRSLATRHMHDLFSSDATRAKRFNISAAGIYCDYAKHRITDHTLQLLVQLAEAQQLPEAIKQLVTGGHVNTTEQRAAWHTRLRQPALDAELLQTKQQFNHIVTQIRAQVWPSDAPLKRIIHIGIGGSDIGSRMLLQALQHQNTSGLSLQFISNCDNDVIHDYLAASDPRHTLVIIASKSFSSQETLSNANIVLDWLGRTRITRQVIAITAKPAQAEILGIPSKHILAIADWVGGRYSIWSAMSLPVAIALGLAQFDELLRGAYTMDQHFAETPLSQNMPVILGLLGIWYTNFFGCQTHAVLPYSSALSLLPAYLQQLTMESLGKRATIHGDFADYSTGAVLWGGIGTNCQHSFLQLLHQGTSLVPVDFIVPLRQRTALANSDLLFANCLAQAQALMMGNEQPEVHQQIPGNKPSTLLVIPELTAYYVGALLAMYEHKTYVQSVVWQINAFDQFGVELGKQMADNILAILQGHRDRHDVDASTRQLIEMYLTQQPVVTTDIVEPL